MKNVLYYTCCDVTPFHFGSFLVIENNPDTGCYFVGRGGFPNCNGVLECDAAVMVGKNCSFGAVAALQGYSKDL